MPSPHHPDDPVADLYDGFLRRVDEPGVAEEIERDIAWRRDAQRAERRAGARIARIIPFAVSFVLPVTPRESLRMALFWAGLAGIVAMSVATGLHTSATALACSVVVVGVRAAIGFALFVSGVDLLFRRDRAGLCQACRYEVASLPPAIDPSMTFGETIGPARCPECGLRWPLVPRSR
jgi:hypothetical protein